MSKKTALITGASSGIGQATARRLATAGFELILVARRQERLQELAKELETKTKVHAVTLDLCDRTAVEDFFQAQQARFKNLNVLVNNAGLARGTEKVQEAKFSDWDEMIDTNVKALMVVSRLALPSLIANRGHIVNLGSVAGRWVYPGGAVYCASKFAVRAFTEGLRMDLAGTGVRVTNIAPGMVETEFSLVRFGSQEQSDRVYQGMTPLSAADIAESIEWCLQRPAHVDIQELVIFPTDQAAVGQVHRPFK